MTWRYSYVVLNTTVSLLAFLRNVLFMRTLGVEDLAQVAIMQTLVMLVGFSQVGMVNGAYVLMAEKKAEQDRQVVGFVWSGLAVLALAFVALASMGALRDMDPAFIAPETLWLGITAGLATMASTFLNNALVARGLLTRSNMVGLAAVSLSLLVGLLSMPYGLHMALLAILVQPVLVGLGVLLSTADLRPAALGLRGDVARRIYRLGGPQFLGAVFVLLGYQLERWAIAAVLGEAALGLFYLVIMYITFFVLVASAILNLHFPPALRSLQAGDLEGFDRSARRHLRDLSIFCAVALPATILPLPWILDTLLPQFSGQAYLVYWAYPAMVVFVARDVFSLAFLSMKRTKPIVISGALFFESYALGVGVLALMEQFTLVTLLAARFVASGIALVYSAFERGRLLSSRRNREVRFR